MNDINILYYETMMDIVSENTKIIDVLGSSKNILENSNMVIIQEGIIDTISNKLKEIFQKVIDFIKKLFENITRQKVFIPDERLIKACNEKLKNMTNEEKDDFFIEKISIRGALINNMNEADDKLDFLYNELDKMIDEINNITTGEKTANPKDSIEFHDKVLKILDDYKKELDGKYDKNQYLKDAKGADIITVKLCLDPSGSTYVNSQKSIANANKYYKDTQKEMKDCQRKMDNIVRNNKSSKDISYEVINAYRNTIYQITICIMKILKFIMDMSIMQYKNEEHILRKFLSYSSHNESMYFINM